MQANIALLTIINRLLASFPATQSGHGDDVVDGYLIGLAGIPDEFIAMAARRFLSGQVPAQSTVWAPSPAQLATEAREHWYKHLDAERLALPPPVVDEPQISDEERARGITRFNELRDKLAEQLRTEQAREEGQRKADWSKVNARFDAQTDEEIRQRLGYSVGDPEGDRGVA